MSFSTPPRKSSKNNLTTATPSTDASSNPSSPRSLPGSPRSPSFKLIRPNILTSNAIGSAWSIEMGCLKQCTTYFEAAECLRRIAKLLDEVDRADRIRFCKPDFLVAADYIQNKKYAWSDDLFRDIVDIITIYFHQDPFRKLSSHLIMEILFWLPINQIAPAITVCWEWSEIVCSIETWRYFYHQKFFLSNPSCPMPPSNVNMMLAFRERLRNPEIGDKVEVAWRGKFRLETQDVYQGLAWWVADIVDKQTKPDTKYKIRYPGWESKWDEWVSMDRLRWMVQRNVVESIVANDMVELWCCGANVPGAWLECKVKKTRTSNTNGAVKYYIARVLQSGNLWVERDRLRLVQRSREKGGLRTAGLDGDADDSETGGILRRNRLSLSSRSLSMLSSVGTTISQALSTRSVSCVIM